MDFVTNVYLIQGGPKEENNKPSDTAEIAKSWHMKLLSDEA